jgi:hypothetical protein
MNGGMMTSEKQLLLIIIAAAIVGLWQLWKDNKEKGDK